MLGVLDFLGPEKPNASMEKNPLVSNGKPISDMATTPGGQHRWGPVEAILKAAM